MPLDELTGPAAPLVAVLVGLLPALVAVLQRRVWRVARTVVTIAHEGGHAVIALLTGRRLSGIRLHSDTSGVTVSVGRPTGPGMAFTAGAGYLAPSVLGLAAAAATTLRWTEALLWLAVVLLVGTLVFVRNWFGGLAVLLTGAVVGAVAWYGTPPTQRGFCAAGAWFLLLGGVRAVHELGQGRGRQLRRRELPLDSDADQLARLTGVPAGVWVALFAVGALGALALGGWWLLGDTLDELGLLPTT